MEKDNFLALDFTILEVIVFATDSFPLGIKIQKYHDFRDNEGFKNVFLGNSAKSYGVNALQFATPEQMKVLGENIGKGYEVHVARHELLGKGVGKLIYRNSNGKIPHAFVDPSPANTLSHAMKLARTGTATSDSFLHPMRSAGQIPVVSTCAH
jgi:hypothetical protein